MSRKKLSCMFNISFTATILDKKGNTIVSDPEGYPANPFDFGSGFVDLTHILNPGLVFNSSQQDYKSFLCSVGYDNHSLQIITGDSNICIKPAPLAVT
jgi:lipoprotein signal peptidase